MQTEQEKQLQTPQESLYEVGVLLANAICRLKAADNVLRQQK